jgi:hypothetical protein
MSVMFIAEREALKEQDFVAAGVEAPDWVSDPIPSLETWRRWRAAEDKAMAHKRVLARAARNGAREK